jgi:hypothetical protein
MEGCITGRGSLFSHYQMPRALNWHIVCDNASALNALLKTLSHCALLNAMR